MPKRDGTPTRGEFKLMRKRAYIDKAIARASEHGESVALVVDLAKQKRSHKMDYGNRRKAKGKSKPGDVPFSKIVSNTDDVPTLGPLSSEEGGGVKRADGTLSIYPPADVATPNSHVEGQSSVHSPILRPDASDRKLFVRSEKRERVITLPHLWIPRFYQIPVMAGLDSGQNRAITVWHRRAGKDNTAANYTAKETQKRVGTYWHVLPTAKQARKVVWEGIDGSGRRVIDQAFPKELRKKIRDDDMMIELTNGAIWRLVGGDNYDSLVGGNPVGVTYSEFSLMDPMAWNYTRPILAENGGWAWFFYTPRGKNHAFKLLRDNVSNPKWFSQILTVNDTKIPNILERIEDDRRSGMPEEMIQQEYYCSFEAALVGAVYGKEMFALRQGGRVTTVDYDPSFPVETWWDLGYNDLTVVLFAQRVGGNRINIIDCYEARNTSLIKSAAAVLAKPYLYSRHVAPHDIEHHEQTNGERRIDTLKTVGMFMTTAPKLSLEDGIEAVRNVLPRIAMDGGKCERLVDAMEQYRREWDEEKAMLSKTPTHDWTSHFADAVRTGATAPDWYGIMPSWAVESMNAHAERQKFSVAAILKGPTQGMFAQEYDPLRGM